MTNSLYYLGTTLGGITALDGLGLSDPYGLFVTYKSVKPRASGKSVGVGFPGAAWSWGFITVEERDILRTFCPYPAVSADVFIITKTREHLNTFATFSAIMHWPQEEDPANTFTYRINWIIEFSHLICLDNGGGFY